MVVVLCCKARCLWDDAKFKETAIAMSSMARLAAAMRGRDSLSQLSRWCVPVPQLVKLWANDNRYKSQREHSETTTTTTTSTLTSTSPNLRFISVFVVINLTRHAVWISFTSPSLALQYSSTELNREEEWRKNAKL